MSSKLVSPLALKARQAILAEMRRQCIKPYKLSRLANVDSGNTHRFFHAQECGFNPSFDTIAKYMTALEMDWSQLQSALKEQQ